MNRVIRLSAAAAVYFCSSVVMAVSQSDYASSPPIESESSSAFTMINLSVEWTQQAEAYTDGEQVYVGNQTYCPGRINDLEIGGGDIPDSTGICYHAEETYIGYFDPKKCYLYDTTGTNTNTTQTPVSPSTDTASGAHPDPHYFRPVRMADAGHKCRGQEFSGNFMNWATMTAADEFRYATTGGARLIDTIGSKAKTLLTRAHRTDWRFVNKAISATGLTQGGVTFSNNPKDVTAFNGVDHLIVEGHEFKNPPEYNGQLHNTTTFYHYSNGRRINLGTYNIIVEVCNPDVGLEANCKEYTDGNLTWYKPEGVLLENAQNIRYALMTYTAKSGNEMGGGVLRAQAKHVGYFRPLPTGGVEINPNAEIDEFGRYIYNPDNAAIGNGVLNSGLLNYINSFGLGRYKNRDPVSEIFYEGLRYFRGLQPTPEYLGKSNLAGYDIRLDDSDKDNFPFIETWEDPIVNACQTNYMIAAGDQFAFADSNLPGTSFNVLEPSVPDNFFNVTEITDKVGDFEGYVGRGPTLGQARRWQPNNTYYIAGLAHHAHTQDIRPDIEGKQTVKTFIVDTQEFKTVAPEGRENQLWLTAKYGGFNDTNGDGNPNISTDGSVTEEWDSDKDGKPDTYTLASQPANLIAGLRAALGEISDSVNAGSALGAVTNNSSGETLLVQALYQPRRSSQNGASLEWTGVVQSLFLDSVGRFREDARVNGVSDGKITDADPVITFTSNPDTGVTLANRSQARGNATVGAPFDTGIEPEQLHTVWNVRDELAELTDYVNNRDYTKQIGTGEKEGRYIFTHIDANDDGKVALSEVMGFTEDNFDAGINAAHLGLAQDDSTQPEDLVNYIRGVEFDAFRSRSSDFDGDGQSEPWLLGDVISSTPVVDAGISSITRYDATYRDTSLTAFIDKYKDARHMVYFGANDGMIRGVNAGFFDPQTKGYVTSRTQSDVAHPLGAEMWAYVPQSVLPHLQWLKNKDYKHNYYVDGIPNLYTVNIFGGENGTIYPNGWGKILVVGTGFGGGQFNIDTDQDGQADKKTYPSFVILDVTDPESPPKLLAEVSHPELGFTTSRPTLAFFRKPNLSGSYQNPDRNEWYLVMGSGPTGQSKENLNAAVTQGVSDQQARVFVYDLIKKDWVSFTLNGQPVPYYRLGNQDNAFIGAATAVDWDQRDGYSTDAIYLGTVGGNINAPTGDMFRLVPGQGGVISAMKRQKLLVKGDSGTLGEPIQGVPETISRLGERWVYFGTGRFIGDQDIKSQSQAGFYAVREFPTVSGQPYLEATNKLGQLFNVTNIATKYDPSNPSGELVNAAGNAIKRSNNRFSSLNASSAGEEENLTLEDLSAVIRNKRGWYRRFAEPNARQVGRVEAVNDAVFYTVYTPGLDACNNLGSTNLVGVNATAGVSPAFSILGNEGLQGGTVTASNERFLSVGLVKDVTVLSNLTFESPEIIDSEPQSGDTPDDNTRINPGRGRENGNPRQPNNGNPRGNGPNLPTGSGAGGNPNPNNGDNNSNDTPASSGIQCGPGFPIASVNASSTPSILPVRNCRRLSGRLLWREVPLPW